MTIGVRLILSAILLGSGTGIYALFRPYCLLWGQFASLSIEFQSEWTPPAWVIYSLPDALWYGAMLTLQPSGPFGKLTMMSRILIVISILLGPLHELLQAINVVSGTFCLTDLFLYSVTLTIFLICKKVTL